MEKEVEIWKPVTIPEVLGLYEVSSQGRVISLSRPKHTPQGGRFLSRNRLLTPNLSKNGYLTVTLSNKPFNKTIGIHVLVALVFCENPDNHGFVNHENGIKKDNCYNNLKWCTRSYNMLHAFRTGLISKCKKKYTRINSRI